MLFLLIFFFSSHELNIFHVTYLRNADFIREKKTCLA